MTDPTPAAGGLTEAEREAIVSAAERIIAARTEAADREAARVTAAVEALCDDMDLYHRIEARITGPDLGAADDVQDILADAIRAALSSSAGTTAQRSEGLRLSMVDADRVLAEAEQRGWEKALREAADEVDRVESVGLTPADQIPDDERGWFDTHPLRNVDGYQRHRPVIAVWLRDRAAAVSPEGGGA